MGPISLYGLSGSRVGDRRYFLSNKVWLVKVILGAGVAGVGRTALELFDGAADGSGFAGVFAFIPGEFKGEFSLSVGRSIKLVTGLGWLLFLAITRGSGRSGGGLYKRSVGLGRQGVFFGLVGSKDGGRRSGKVPGAGSWIR